jgi:hypothetical protein
MIYKPVHFEIQELVCPHIFFRYGVAALQFFDFKVLMNHDWLRDLIDVPVFINNWNLPEYRNSKYIKEIERMTRENKPIFPSILPLPPAGLLDERGYRCNLCSTVYRKSKNGILYMSAHTTGQAFDSNSPGKTAEEIRTLIKTNQNRMPFPARVEKDVTWLHLDSRQKDDLKLYEFSK